MLRRLNHINRSHLIFIVLAFGCLTLLGASSLGVGSKLKIHSRQEQQPRVENKTQAFQVISLMQRDAQYILSLRNNSPKNINGYSIGVGLNGKLVTDLTVGDRVIAPDEVAEERIPISNLLRASNGSVPQQQIITVLAVMFEDGSSDGDRQAILETEHRRLGVKIQLRRILALLQTVLVSPDSDNLAALNKLKTQISSLSEEPDGGLPPRVRFGLRSVKEDLISQIQELEQDPTNIREKLSKIKGKVDRRFARLRNI